MSVLSTLPLIPRVILSWSLAGLVILALTSVAPGTVGAQEIPDSLRSVRDTVVLKLPKSDSIAANNQALALQRTPMLPRLSAPLTPRRAFLYSLALPGLGQSRLDRGSSGALFASAELAALVMLSRTSADVREAKRFLTDTLPESFTVTAAAGGDGVTVQPSGKLIGTYTSELIRARRLHAEDWIALLAFNHLFSGADAFVAAQLWELPFELSAVPASDGPMLVVTVRF